MEKKIKNNKITRYVFWTIIFIVTISSLAIIFNFFFIITEKIKINYPNIYAKNLNKKDWLSFFGSCIGGVATLAAILAMWEQNKEILNEQKKNSIIEFEREKIEKMKQVFIDVLKSIDVLIFVKIKTSTNDEKINTLNIIQENILKSDIEMQLLTNVEIESTNCIECQKYQDCSYLEISRELLREYVNLRKKYFSLITITKFIMENPCIELIEAIRIFNSKSLDKFPEIRDESQFLLEISENIEQREKVTNLMKKYIIQCDNCMKDFLYDNFDCGFIKK